jgi:predicted RNase H-like HicB family nuclease
MKDYHINIFYSEADGEYIADIPDLEPYSASGETPEQVLAEVMIAKELCLETARQEGVPIPDPKYRPAIYQVVT